MSFLLFGGARVGGLESAHVISVFLYFFGEHMVSLPNIHVHIMFRHVCGRFCQQFHSANGQPTSTFGAYSLHI